MKNPEYKQRTADDPDAEKKAFCERATAGNAAGEREQKRSDQQSDHRKSSGQVKRVCPFGSFIEMNA